ncbi:hypothetical protein [Bartonella koehlerae]|uniref:hypothetical protein n=1 Tax=Bartonella koehlerae TaxID=92181 RepID=UPI000AA09559|nr:hypothetical protein [Bartonella koehlerae]
MACTKQLSIFLKVLVFISGTILENLYLAKTDTTEDEINAAIRASACHDLIAQLPQWLNTQVGE